MTALAIFAKAPVPGQCKTRLMPLMSAEAAAGVHQQLVLRTLNTALESQLSPVQLWCAGDRDHPFLIEISRRFGVERFQQQGSDLGERIIHLFNTHQTPLLLIGSDCPVLTPELLQRCAAELKTHDAVFLPAEDGGYALVGLNQPQPELFRGVEWGSGRVMTQTREHLQRLQLSWSELEQVWDVDRPEDYQRARQMLESFPVLALVPRIKA
ncbi:TIGR04282 family arsenosugar biosynthesis glycosyltransferase [Nitrincola sp. MINF-07-Sa-05]|uniref:TIGR04282 family arsenosugar biosynthesis glycosyltransferase n=1 Tax=Nitrincola salilacus TaxID=3400273 RepID=UPI003917D426